MRSYEVVRNLFSFFSLLSWIVIIIGGFAAVAGFSTATSVRATTWLHILGAVTPGLLLIGIGFFCIAVMQIGRANVDSAEYSQQSLDLARKQYEIIKQMLRLAETAQPASTYVAPTEPEALKDISFDTAAPEHTAPDPEPVLDPNRKIDRVHQYANTRIEEIEGKFLIENRSYDTLNDAKLAVHGPGLRAAVSKT